MNHPIPRRQFLKAAPVAAFALSQIAQASAAPPAETGAQIKIEPFDYRGVRLLPSQWQKQYFQTRDTYLAISDDDILHGYRLAAGLPAPGKPLGGWCRQTSDTVFGQWLSGMARMYRATNETALRDKAIHLFTEWSKTIPADGNPRMRHYGFDKLVCGLVDLKQYADFDDALPMLERVTRYASKNFNHDNVPGQNVEKLYSGNPGEWYTLSENLYRAYELTGNPFYKDFAATWLYHAYWDKFLNSTNPDAVQGIHAYSHVNTFSSAAMAYWVTGDEKYLRTIKNAYDWMQNEQCFATGGFGPGEDITGPTETRGDVLDKVKDTFETGCGSWAIFKLSRYLQQFTADAHYGDWAERIFYNGIGAALPMTVDGRNFYYSDYRVGGGTKIYYQATFACCAGTYIQAVADYHNIIYYKDPTSLYVNLYIPSEVTWNHPSRTVKLTQETNYPAADTSTFTLAIDQNGSAAFPLKFRIPAWAKNASLRVNGTDAKVACPPGQWASIQRAWKSGDRIEITLPQTIHLAAVDKLHPRRAAVMRGPVVLVLENEKPDPAFHLPDTDAALQKALTPDATPNANRFTLRKPDGTPLDSKFRPFDTVPEKYPYRMYFDT
jgi:uncharacterized protein